MSWIGVGSLAVSAGVSIYKGIQQKNEAKKLAASSIYGGPTVPQALLENRQMAQNDVNNGLPSEQYQNAMKNIQRQQNTAVLRAQSRRAGLSIIPNIQGQTNNATDNLDVADARMRLMNRRTLMGANNAVGGYQGRDIMRQQGLADRNYNYAMSLQGAGNQNINNGIDSGIAGIAGGVGGYLNTRKYNKGLATGGSGGYDFMASQQLD